MVKRAKPAAGDGGSRQCIGSEQNLTADCTERQTSTQGATALPIDQMIVADRTRRDLGDIAGLATGIAKIAQLNPITVDENGRLLDHARRLAACKRRKRPLRGWP